MLLLQPVYRRHHRRSIVYKTTFAWSKLLQGIIYRAGFGCYRLCQKRTSIPGRKVIIGHYLYAILNSSIFIRPY